MFKNVYMLYFIYIFIQLYPLSAHNVCLTPRLLVHRHCHICLYLIFCCRDIYLLICLYLTCHVMYDLREIKCMFCSVLSPWGRLWVMLFWLVWNIIQRMTWVLGQVHINTFRNKVSEPPIFKQVNSLNDLCTVKEFHRNLSNRYPLCFTSINP